VTSVPEEAEAAGSDYLVLDEGEITIPLFLQDLGDHGVRRREDGGAPIVFRSGGIKPEVTSTPIPRFDLLDLTAYDGMAVQYSRGCPFLCEFCDIITLYGRKPRAKSPQQFIAELEYLLSLGRRGAIFLVDDNFIGNKKNVKKLLLELRDWQRQHNFPFSFDTEASIDLAADPELLQLMVDCRFSSVFIGIETPDAESLALTRKHQNNRHPMIESVSIITRAGLRVMCGMIIGFDNEAPGAGQRIVEFVRATNIPTVLFSMLQALPNTALWTRLDKEGRLLCNTADLNQTTVLNFTPTRPVAQIVNEYIEAYSEIYSPKPYLRRVYRHFLELSTAGASMSGSAGETQAITPPTSQPSLPVYPKSVVNEAAARSRGMRTNLRQNWMMVRAFVTVAWRQGVMRDSRFLFWLYLIGMAVRRPSMFGYYLVVCAHFEHFALYRDRIRQQLLPMLAVAAPTRTPGSSANAISAQQVREVTT
jgi:radical SAM superfamily enzyme YgiQ (UPF0313 family)